MEKTARRLHVVVLLTRAFFFRAHWNFPKEMPLADIIITVWVNHRMTMRIEWSGKNPLVKWKQKEIPEKRKNVPRNDHRLKWSISHFVCSFVCPNKILNIFASNFCGFFFSLSFYLLAKHKKKTRAENIEQRVPFIITCAAIVVVLFGIWCARRDTSISMLIRYPMNSLIMC